MTRLLVMVSLATRMTWTEVMDLPWTVLETYVDVVGR